ncbi:MAG: response regulator [Bacteroidota bacterium]
MFGSVENKVILYLVDDDDLHLKILHGKLEASTNYELQTFRSGEDFLENILRHPPPKKTYPIVLLDYYLKNRDNEDAKNGIEILKIIKEINPGIEVIILSGLEDVDVATSAMHFGAKTFVRKNENSFTRIHSNIQWIISQKDLERKRKQSRTTRTLFFLLLAIVVVAAGLYFFPA